jgi:hypothetical protein
MSTRRLRMGSIGLTAEKLTQKGRTVSLRAARFMITVYIYGIANMKLLQQTVFGLPLIQFDVVPICII